MSDVIVIGAGMVGVTTAIALQDRGHSVILVDRKAPGREASYGNAGIIQLEVMEPYAFPRSFLEIAKIAIGIGNAVHYRLTALPSAAVPLWQYYYHSAPHRHAQVSAVYRQLIARSGKDHDRLIQATDSSHMIKRTGYIQMHRDGRNLEKTVALAERYASDFGVTSRVLGPVELRRHEPALRSDFAGAVHWLESLTCSSPGDLVAAYADLFLRQNGGLVQAEVLALSRASRQWRLELRDAAPIYAEHVVVALGAWSPELLKPLGTRIPMVRKRGYHRHLKAAQAPSRPLFDVEASALYCPMRQGVRVTTGAEIAPFGSAPGDQQIERALRSARRCLELCDETDSNAWSGWRPCMPDMLPAVGPVSGQPGLWCNFGHGHQGFTLGPTTGELLADMMSGKETGSRFDRLSPSRFS